MATATKKTPTKTAAKPSTAVATKKTSSLAVADIKAQLMKQAEDSKNRVAAGGGVSIRITQDKQFLLPDGVKTREPLELVVVDFVSRNEFYEGAFNKDDLVPPNCFAINPDFRKMVPSANAPEKQADDCASCPMNQFGSAGAGKACKNTRLLAVLPPDAEEDTPLWLLKVSPTAIKRFDSFVASVNRTHQMPPIAVVVTVGLDESSDYPSLVFSDPVPNENLQAHYPRIDEAKELLMREPDVSAFGAEKPKAPARKAPARKAAVARR